MTVQEKSAREYGSQGQQRSCVLALKLAEAALLAEALGEKPVILLDDVMSELDASRQDYLLNKIPGLAGVYHLLRSQLHFGLIPGQNLLRRKRRDPGVTGPWKSKKTAGAFGQRLEGR